MDACSVGVVVALVCLVVILVLALICAAAQKGTSTDSGSQKAFREEMRARVRCFDNTLGEILGYMRDVAPHGMTPDEAQKLLKAREKILQAIPGRVEHAVEGDIHASDVKVLAEAYQALCEDQDSGS